MSTRLIAAGILGLLSAATAPAQELDPIEAAHADSRKLLQLGRIIAVYAGNHDRQLPPDLGATLEAFEGREGGAAAAVGRHYVSILQPAPEVDQAGAAAWVNEHSAYTYLGRAGLDWHEVADWGSTAIAHLSLATGHTVGPSPENPDGVLFPVLFLDSHVELLSRADAERIIALSRQVYTAHATGSPFPEDRQSVWNAGAVVKAIRAYAAAHEGALPPTLGEALPHVPVDPQRTATPKDRARVFLSPRRAEATFIPDDPAPEWVNRNTSFDYLGSADVLLDRVEDPARTILIRAKADEALRVWRPGLEKLVVTIGAAGGGAENVQREYADWIAEESARVIESARSGAPLPDLQHTMRDLRLIGKAIAAYAKANGGLLPPDFGALLPFIPDEPLWPLSPAERAAVFLSPAAERLAHIPADPDAAWVNERATYIYTGAAGVQLEALQKGPVAALAHLPAAEAIHILTPAGEMTTAPALEGRGHVMMVDPGSAEQLAAKAREAVAAAAMNQGR